MLEGDVERYVMEDSGEFTAKIPRCKSKFRDVKKRARNGVDFAIMAIENQASVDYTMPWRVMQYDQLEYGRQIRKIRERKAQECLRKGKKVSRWTMRFDLEDKMTLVCMDDLEDLSVFHTDLKLLLQAMKMRKNEEGMERLFEKKDFMTVSADTARTIAIMTDHTELLEYLAGHEDEGGINRCQAVDEMRRKYINKGMEEGVKEGIQALITTCQELNASYEYVVEKLEEKYSLSEAETQNYMNLYWIRQ